MNIASIDIGTNTVLLLIAETNLTSKNIKTLHNEYRIPRIGQGLLPNNPINSEKLILLFKYLDEFERIILEYNCKYIIITATNAFRIASNSKVIISEIKNKFGWDTNIVSGKEESRLSYLGAVNEYNYDQKNLVIDIGGGSTEIIFGINNQILFNDSFPFGVVSYTEEYFKKKPPSKDDINNFSINAAKYFNRIDKYLPDKTIAIAGTPTTLACIKQNIKYFDEALIEGTILTNTDIKQFVEILLKLSPAEIRQSYGNIVEGREDVLLAGTLILNLIIDYFEIDEVTVSSKGIRYGALVDFLQKYF